MSNEKDIKFELSLGAVKDKKDKRDYRLCSIQAPIDLPEEFVLPSRFNCKNQFSRGSCTSQAQAHHKERQEGEKISARCIMALTKELEGNEDYGAMTRNTFKIVNSIGVSEIILQLNNCWFLKPSCCGKLKSTMTTSSIPLKPAGETTPK